MTWKPKHPSRLAGAFGGLLCMHLAAAQNVDQIYDAGEERILQAQAQQQEIDAIVEVTEDRFEAYQVLLREIEDLQVYNNLLQAQVDAQNRTLRQLYAAIDEVGVIERQILPLMTRMISGLERFVALDVPFLVNERNARVARLKSLLLRSDVTAAEQFRNVLEAWLIEMEDYGTTGDVYKQEIVTPDGVTREVELLRIGRIALLYVTPDGSQAGAWDNNARQWVELDDSMSAEIRTGIESYESGQPALFVAPVPPPEDE
jgi:hypothetical protein